MNIEQLEKLNELREKGIITSEQFEHEKKRLLGEKNKKSNYTLNNILQKIKIIFPKKISRRTLVWLAIVLGTLLVLAGTYAYITKDSYEGQKECEMAVKKKNNKYLCHCLYTQAKKNEVKNFKDFINTINSDEKRTNLGLVALSSAFGEKDIDNETKKYIKTLQSVDNECSEPLNFWKPEWWKTATLEDVKAEIEKVDNINAGGNDRTSGGALRTNLTPLIFAIKYGNSNIEIIKLLIKAGADVNAREGEIGLTALMYATQFSRNPEIIDTLISAGADVNARKNDGFTVLMQAAMFDNNGEITQTLIKNGADINAKGEYNLTPLTEALKFNKNDKVIEILLKYGAEVKVKNQEGYTPLELAILSKRDSQIIQSIIERGANVNDTLPCEDYEFEDACKSVLDIAVKYIKEPKIIKLIIDSGVALRDVLETGLTQLDNAAQIAAEYNDNIDILKLLIEYGADVKATSEGYSLLMAAASHNGNPNIIKFLVEKGLDVNAIDSEGATALIYAAQYNSNPEIVNILLDLGADVLVAQYDGSVALDYAKNNPNMTSSNVYKRLSDLTYEQRVQENKKIIQEQNSKEQSENTDKETKTDDRTGSVVELN